MLHVSTKNSVKKGQQCKYTFIVGKVGKVKPKILLKLRSNAKCTEYDEYTTVKGKVNALVEFLTDVSDVHLKCHPCMRNEMLNKINQLELTRVPSGLKTYLKIPTSSIPSFIPLSLRKTQLSRKALVLQKYICFYPSKRSKENSRLFKFNDKVKFRKSKTNESTTLISKVVNIRTHRHEIYHKQYLSTWALSLNLTRYYPHFYMIVVCTKNLWILNTIRRSFFSNDLLIFFLLVTLHLLHLHLLHVNLLHNKYNYKNNYKHNYSYSHNYNQYNHGYNELHRGIGLLTAIGKIATNVVPLYNSGYDLIHSRTNIICGYESNGYKHKNKIVITNSDSITVSRTFVLIVIRSIVNRERLSNKNCFLCALSIQLDQSKEKELHKQQSYKKIELRFIISSLFHESTLNLDYGSEMFLSLLVFEDDRCHHRTQESLQQYVVNRLHVWGQTVESNGEDIGDIAELQGSCADAVAPAGSAVVNNDNAIVAVTIIGESSCSIVTVVGSCSGNAVAIVVIAVIAGRGGARRARRGKSSVGGRTNTDEMCLDLMTRDQRNVGYDLVVSEQEVPGQTAYRTMKETMKIYIIENLIFTKMYNDLAVDCKAAGIEKVNSFLRQIKSEWCTSTIVAMRTKPYNNCNWQSNTVYNCTYEPISYSYQFSITVNLDKTNIDKGNLLKAIPGLTNLECFLSIPQILSEGSLRTQNSKKFKMKLSQMIDIKRKKIAYLFLSLVSTLNMCNSAIYVYMKYYTNLLMHDIEKNPGPVEPSALNTRKLRLTVITLIAEV
jgi:hypothetical protein